MKVFRVRERAILKVNASRINPRTEHEWRTLDVQRTSHAAYHSPGTWYAADLNMADNVGNTSLYREIKVLATHACAHKISQDKKKNRNLRVPVAGLSTVKS